MDGCASLYHMLIKVYSESVCSDRVCDWYLKFYTNCIYMFRAKQEFAQSQDCAAQNQEFRVCPANSESRGLIPGTRTLTFAQTKNVHGAIKDLEDFHKCSYKRSMEYTVDSDGKLTETFREVL